MIHQNQPKPTENYPLFLSRELTGELSHWNVPRPGTALPRVPVDWEQAYVPCDRAVDRCIADFSNSRRQWHLFWVWANVFAYVNLSTFLCIYHLNHLIHFLHANVHLLFLRCRLCLIDSMILEASSVFIPLRMSWLSIHVSLAYAHTHTKRHKRLQVVATNSSLTLQPAEGINYCSMCQRSLSLSPHFQWWDVAVLEKSEVS